MKLQIAFDLNDIDKAIAIAKDVAPYASILEVGSVLIYRYGTKSIETFKELFPEKTILADVKIVDRAKQAVTTIVQAGADWVTVMAGTSKDVIHAACTTAHDLHAEVMLDLLDACSAGQSALEAKSLGVNALLFHGSAEEDPLTFLDKWQMIRGNTKLPIFVAGKITEEAVDKIKSLNPDGLVLSKVITEATNPAETAKLFYETFSL